MSTTQIPATLGATQEDIVAEENDMCDTEQDFTDVLRRKTAQLVDWAETAVETNGDQNDASFETMADRVEEQDFELVVEAKKRDNLLICETLVSVGLLQNPEMSRLQTVQAESDDIVGALLLASAIRSRLGEILLQAKCITSSQLEHALELQRQSGDLLGEILVRLNWLEHDALDVALAAQAQRNARRYSTSTAVAPLRALDAFRSAMLALSPSPDSFASLGENQ
jgi:hypothetical protein